MTIILTQYTMPETGTFEIHQAVNIQVSAKEAQRQVDSWLLNEVSSMMGAEPPTLVIGARTVWRVPCYYSAPGAGRVGTVGELDVDVQTGEMDNPTEAKVAILLCAKRLAKKLPPFQPKIAPPEYVAKNGPPVPRLQIKADGELTFIPPVETP